MLFRDRRRKKLAARPFPDEWLAILVRSVPLYARLPEADREELKRHLLVFLAEKRFEGCGGLEITDEIRVTIAAHACLLLLHRKTD
ncbi:MAG: zinc-dependent peptidase, partial [Phycisphaerales bacterium]